MNPPPLPVERENPPSVSAGITGMFNVFIDPAATAKAVRAPWAWLWPLIITSIASIIYGMFFTPLMMDTMRKYPPNGVSGAQLDQAMHFTEIVTRVSFFLSPLLIAGVTALFAALIMLTASMISMRVKFRDIFSLMSVCSLINVLQIIASYFVLKAKADEIGSMQQLQPAFGLDIFFGELKGPLFAILNYFSLFQVWYLVILGLSLAFLTGSSKGKAFAAITPAWLIPLLFKIVGSLFQRS
jgi:hypothetical protein